MVVKAPLFSDINVKNLIQRGFKPSTEGVRKGVTAYSKVLPKTGTQVVYYLENGKAFIKDVAPGKNSVAARVNNIVRISRSEGETSISFSKGKGKNHISAILSGPHSNVQNSMLCNSLLQKAGYDCATRWSSITRGGLGYFYG